MVRYGSEMKKQLLIPIGILAAMAATAAFAARSDNESSNRSRSGTSYDSNASQDSRGAFGSRSRSDPSDKNAKTDRDKERQDKKRDDNRNRASNQPGTPGAKPAPKATSTVKGKKPAPKKAAASGGTGRGTTNVEFKIQADATRNLLYLETSEAAPSMHVVAEKGKRFVTRTVFRNARRSAYDAVEISLKYDPSLMKPLGLDDSGVDGLLASPGEARFDARRGIISYRAQFAEPRRDEIITLFKVDWKALAPTVHTSLQFQNSEKHRSVVLMGESNVLHSQSDDEALEYSVTNGLLGADIAIVPDGKTLLEMEEDDSGMGGVALAREISDGSAEGGVMLALRNRQDPVMAGDEFLVDIVYSNPRRMEIDSMRIRLRFDPRVLQVVDYDEGNWITKGVNIFDGDYHEDLPFDFHIRNMVYNNTGELQYEMGFAERAKIPGSGVVATIRFKALAPTESTSVQFDLDENGKTSRTAVSFLGFNLIGTPGERANALSNVALRIN